jgi:3-oxoacyl-[acyl-carrier protein] reductase
MELGLKGRTALVTASTGGIGLEIARALAAEGARVIVNGRTDAGVAAAIESIRNLDPAADLLAAVADCGTRAGTEALFEEVPEVDILVNNLGVYDSASILDLADEEWLRLFEVNILSGVRLTRHYLPGMLTRNSGRVVFIASEAALTPAPELPHYSATKTMQLAISRIFAEATRGTQVTVNAVLPGSTRTVGVEHFVQDLFPELPYDEAEKRFMAENRSTSIIGRLIRPEEVAALVTFVAGEATGAINGSVLRTDGGIVRTVF